jgi:hypothetical protein
MGEMSKKTEFRFSFSLPAEAMTRIEMAELLDSYIAQLQEAKEVLLSGESTSVLVRLGKSKKKLIGPEGRRKIADAQRARWVKVKKAMGS